MLHRDASNEAALSALRQMFATSLIGIATVEMIDNEATFKHMCHDVNRTYVITGLGSSTLSEVIIRETDSYDFYEVKIYDVDDQIVIYYRVKTGWHNARTERILDIIADNN